VRPLLALKDETLRDNDVLHYNCFFLPRYTAPLEQTGLAVSRLVHGFFQPFDMLMARDVGTLIKHPLSAAESTAARFGFRARVPVFFDIVHTVEQAPNPNSRVTLTAERDALDVPVVSLHWALSEIDYRTFARGQELMIAEISALGLGRFAPEPLTRVFVEQTVLGHWHHMGTTRMSASPGSGVVDTDCRVHGTNNLFVAGSGIYPSATGGSTTMMLIALALRLAEHLDAKVLA
jgi:choline dehydrogenase-like flavoprotein